MQKPRKHACANSGLGQKMPAQAVRSIDLQTKEVHTTRTGDQHESQLNALYNPSSTGSVIWGKWPLTSVRNEMETQ